MKSESGYRLKSGIVIILTCLLVLVPTAISAHPSDDYFDKLSRTDVFFIYLELGFTHIIPLGFDHILFILSLFLLSPKLKTIIWQATAFTVAHSITLGLAMFGLVSAPSHIVEPIIALSIMFVAIENIITDKLKPTRVLIVFAFGLIHGLGFAGVLKDLGLPKKEYVNALISFNVGVELGQITIIVAAWLLFGKWFNKKPWYRKFIVNPLSAVIALIALYWTIERAFFN
ncbi:MAG: HupE/UreJ family protein [Bacteroidetes bacterium]|nr:HupE/UreJ family protein [Bacteroidota bacterium]